MRREHVYHTVNRLSRIVCVKCSQNQVASFGGGESRFPSTMRLKLRRDFRRVFREGRVWKGAAFTLHVLSRDGEPQMGIVISRRWGNAVERNRMKRLLREAFRKVARSLPDVAIIVKPAVACRSETVETLERKLAAAIRDVTRREVPD